MKRLLFTCCGIISLVVAQAQTTMRIKSGATVKNTQATVNMPAGSFVNDGTYTDNTGTGTFNVLGGVTFSGSGTTMMYDINFLNSGSSVFSSVVSVHHTATIGASASVNAGAGNLYLRSDIPLSGANLVNNGTLTGTVQGLVTNATATSGPCGSYTSTLSHNVSGTKMLYQWQSSPDNSVWTDISSANSATYLATVTTSLYYRCVLTTTNTVYNQATPGIQLISINSRVGISGPVSTICQGGTTAALGGSFADGATGAVWDDGGAGGSFTNNTGSTPGTATYTAASTAPLSVNLTLTSTGGSCVATNTVTVLTVNPGASLSGLSTTKVLCYDGVSAQTADYAYTGIVNGADEYSLTWSPSGPDNTSLTSLPGTPGGTLNTNVSAGTLQGTYTGTLFVENSGTGCSSSTPVTLTINRVPVVTADITTSNPVCVGSGVTLDGGDDGTGFNVQYSWAGPTTADISSASSEDASITGAALVDDGVYTLTASAPVCADIQATTAHLVVNQLPSLITASVSPNPACLSGTVFLASTITGGTGYTLQWTGGVSSITDNTLSSASIAGVVSGDATAYVLTATAIGCGTTFGTTDALVVNTPPSAVSPVLSKNPACVADNITISGGVSGGTNLTYAWSGPGGTAFADATAQPDAAITGLVSGNAGIYTLSVTAAGCTPVVGTTDLLNPLVVNQLPSLSPDASPNPVCAGGTLSLSGNVSGGAGYSLAWTGGTTGITNATSDNASISPVAPTGDDGIYTLTASAPGCGSTFATTSSVVVNTQPSSVSPSLSGSPLCAGDNLNLTGNVTGGSALSYSWAGPGGTIISTPANVDASVSGVAVTNTGVYSLTVTAAGCASQLFTTAALTVQQLPSAITASVTPTPTCDGGVLNLKSNQSGGGNYTLEWDGPNATATSHISNNTLANTSIGVTNAATDAGAYILTAIAPACVVAPTVAATTSAAVINPAPTGLSGTTAKCAGQNTTWTITTGSGGSWVSDNTPVATVDPALGVVYAVSSGTANISYTNGAGAHCTVSALFTTNALPAVTFTTHPGASSCQGSTGTYITQPGQAAGSYVWGIPGTVSVVSGGTNLTNTLTVTYPGTGNQSVSVNYTDGNGCTATTATSNITNVTALPADVSVTDVGGLGTYCGSASISAANGSDGTIYRQTSASGTSTATPYTGPVTVTSTGTYYFRAQSATGCWGNAGSVSVTINPNPTPHTVTGSTTICTGGSATIGLNGSGPLSTTYELVHDGVQTGTTVTSSSGAISFPAVSTGIHYTVLGTLGTCTLMMTSEAVVNVTTTPLVHNVTGGGGYCANATSGPAIGLNGSESGVSYRLLVNGTTQIGSDYTSPGGSIDFASALGLPSFTVTGVYTVIANPGSLCQTSMSGSATVSVTPAPNIYSLNSSGSTTICSGSTGPDMYLSNSQTIANYQLFRLPADLVGSARAGTGFPLDFGTQGTGGSYYVVAVLAGGGGCQSYMTGTVTVTSVARPAVLAVSASAAGYCPGSGGVTIHLSGTSETNVNYQLLKDGVAVAGAVFSGDGIGGHDFTNQLSGTYAAVATNTVTGCTSAMTGTVTVAPYIAPAVYNVTGGGGYCTGTTTGVPVGLSFSSSSATYQLSQVGVGDVGLAQTGTGAAISFGNIVTTGIYSVSATSSDGCKLGMNYTATVSTVPLPNNSYTISGSGSYCSGTGGRDITMTGGSESGVNYTLYKNNVSTGITVAGGGSMPDFGTQASGHYTIITTGSMPTSCTNTLTSTADVTVTPLPAQYSVSGGGAMCAGVSTSSVTLSPSSLSVPAVTYRLYKDGVNTGTSQSGTGATLTFSGLTAGGVYSVQADSAGCQSMTGTTATITVNTPPTAYTVTESGDGTLCSGGTGITLGLSGSQGGVTYQLLRNGVTPVTTATGTGFALSFSPAQATGGSYGVTALTPSTTCTSVMTNTVAVTVYNLPVAQTVTGGGSYCPGTASTLHVGLAASEAGVTYQLYYNGSPVSGASVNNTSGTGTIDFGVQSGIGNYTVGASNNTTHCTNMMGNSVSIANYSVPATYTVSLSGGSSYCVGSTSTVHVDLSGSQGGTTYTLYNGSTSVTSQVGATFPIDFGAQSAGVYSVKATNGSGCTSTMSGIVNIDTNRLPTVFTLSAPGVTSYCTGGSGVDLSLGGTQSGVNYQLYRNGAASGSIVGGSGFSYTYSNTPSGTYTAAAVNGTTGCSSLMSGTVTVTANPLPTAENVTGTASYCAGGAGVIVGLSTTENNVSYQLLKDGIAVSGAVLGGNGTSQNYGNRTAGVYTVFATNIITNCTNTMSGNATVTSNSLTTAYVVTGGGRYCAGGTGVHIGLSGSSLGTSYQLYDSTGAVGTAQAGTNTTIDFGLISEVSTFTVLATDVSTGCPRAMTGSVSVRTNALPAVQNVTGGGGYCTGGSGSHVTLSGSESGVNYQLYVGSTATGTPAGGSGSGLDFGPQTTVGTYSVLATNGTTGCSAAMTQSVTVFTNPLPTQYNVTGTGGYCADGTGIAAGLDGSQNGFQYRLYRGATMVGSVVTGDGNPITFAPQTTAGTYTVKATDNVTGCVNEMSGTAVISINPLPTAYSMNGGGILCAGSPGVHVGLANSTAGLVYALYKDGVATGTTVTGTGTGIDFGVITTGGGYSAKATNTATGCSADMTGTVTVTVNPLPTVYNVTGGGGYCAGGSGMDIGLDGSQIGLSYQLKVDGTSSGTAAAGSGGALDYGLRTLAGTYTIIANNGSTGCTAAMAGSAVITVNPLPTVFAVSGGGGYCAGDSGRHIGLGNSTIGVSYQLYKGAAATGSAVEGTGAAIDFGLIATAGTYTVLATDDNSGCRKVMSGSATISINPLPNTYSVTGGGSYCNGGIGVHVGLGGSEFGFSYQLYNNAGTSGSASAGTTGAIDFGLRTDTGTYIVVASNPSTGCKDTMSGSVAISISQLPAAYNVTGGGQYCAGGSGMAIGLDNSATGVTYKLYNGSAVVATATGGGTSISFGVQLAAGTYSVAATNSAGCTNNMSGSATITINTPPTAYTVTGGGSFCQGTATGMPVGLGNSAVGISYQLYNSSGAVGGLVAGTGTALNFGVQPAGTYSVTATDVPATCSTQMTGNVTVVMNIPPAAQDVSGGGQYCAGGPGMSIGLLGSQAGVTYQLYRGGTATGAAVAGGGGTITFGLQAAAGIYSVSATNTSGCHSDMNGSATITINILPTVYTVTGGGSYCSGTAAGMAVGVSNSSSSVNYDLYNASGLVTTQAGTGGAFNFTGLQPAGSYSVVARDGTSSCPQQMNGSVTVSVNTAPSVQAVTGGVTSYCAGGTGVAVGLAASQSGMVYQLYNGSAVTGGTVAGSSTNGAITFGLQLAAGTYSVTAINPGTGCTAAMSGSATISISPVPATYSVVGGGSYCQGSDGPEVRLSGSQSGVSYNLYQVGNPSPVSTVIGDGIHVIDFLNWTAGTYTVSASAGGCSSAMSGTAVISENALPQVHNITGGGSYCSGGAGLTIGLDGSNPGTSYQLYKDGVPSGAAVSGIISGGAISFGPRIDFGIYSVIATISATGCTQSMSNNQTISINTLPVAYTVTGGGGYCSGIAGVSVGVDNAEANVTYVLFKGGVRVDSVTPAIAGAITFGLRPDGNYTVSGRNASGCITTMTGTATVTLNSLPATFTVTGGGAYCSGGAGLAIGLSNSVTGISYQLLYNGGATGTALSGHTGTSLDFGLQTLQGNYTVAATNSTTGCSSITTSSQNVSINPLPAVYDVSGGGGYCSGSGGVNVLLSASQGGVTYRLYLNGGATPVGTLGGSPVGAGLDFGPQAAGSYVVTATDANHCTSTMNNTAVVSVNNLPAAYTILSSASHYCAGGGGVDISLSSSDTGVSYLLYNGTSPVGTAKAGTGAPVDFGLQLAQGAPAYTIKAMNNNTGCSAVMNSSIPLMIDALPTAQAMTGGGSYCSGSGTGVHMGMATSQGGVRYDLYTASVLKASATGPGAIDFGLQATGGTYLVIATNTATGCSASMPGSEIVTVNMPPVAYLVSGGGDYCAGTGGRHITLSGSDTGTSYQLYNGTLPTGTALTGTASGLDFGLSTGNGIYTVKATRNTTGCMGLMDGSATIHILSAPASEAVTGGGGYCQGGSGMAVGVTPSQGGVTYYLYNGSASVDTVTGTGTAVSFGDQLTAGTYTVMAVSGDGCTANMSGSASITINLLPVVQTIGGGGAYCSGSGGVHIGLNSSVSGTRYQLYMGTTAVGAAVNAVTTGAALDFGLQTIPGIYSAYAINNTSGCATDMSGTVSVVMNPTVHPSATIVSSGDTVCAGTVVSFTALTSGGGTAPAYNWDISGTSVSTANSYSYVPGNNDMVTLTLTSSAPCAVPAVVSTSHVLTVHNHVTPLVSVTAVPGDTVCRGTVVSYIATPVYGGTTPGYAWLVNGQSVVGSSQAYTYTPAQGDVVLCQLTSNYPCRSSDVAFSTPVKMTVDSGIAPSVQILVTPGAKITSGKADTLVAVVTNGGNTAQYQWYINGSVVPLATHPVFISSSFGDGDSVTCQVQSSGACGSLSGFNSVIIRLQDVAVTGVNNAGTDIRLVPNPNKGTFTVKGTLASKLDQEVTIEVTDVLGQVLYSNKSTSHGGTVNEVITLGSAANGMYMLSLKTATDSRVFHVVVEQ